MVCSRPILRAIQGSPEFSRAARFISLVALRREPKGTGDHRIRLSPSRCFGPRRPEDADFGSPQVLEGLSWPGGEVIRASFRR